MTINYTPGKANVVADALSRKATCHQMKMEHFSKQILQDLGRDGILMVMKGEEDNISALDMQCDLQREIKRRQLEDEFITEEIRRINIGQPSEFTKEGFVFQIYQKLKC